MVTVIRLIAVTFFIGVLNMKTIRAAVYCRVSSNKRIQMHSVEAQQESVNKSNHIKWGLEAGYRSGSSGLAKRICYGYKKDENGELIICPEQAENVQLIYELYLSGYSLSGIAKELKQRGIDSPTGKETWTSCAIDKILSNEKYTGDVLLQKTFRRDVFSGKQIQNHGEQAQYFYENNHSGIVTHEIFERVQMEKKRRSNRCSDNAGMRRKNTRFSQGNTLSGKIRCEECGRNFRRIKTRKGEIFWQCAGQVEHTSDCHAMKLNQTEINDFLKRKYGIEPKIDSYSAIDRILVSAEEYQCVMKTKDN